MAKKMTERERELSKENKRLRKEIERLNDIIGALEDTIEDLHNEPINRQIKEITQDEALKAIKETLSRYGL